MRKHRFPGIFSQPLLWATPAILLLLLCFVAPLIILVRVSLYRGGGSSGFGIGARFYEPGTWAFGAYLGLFGDKYFWDILAFTVKLGFGVTLLCVVLGYGVALSIWRLSSPWKALALSAVILPKFSNLLVTMYGIKLILYEVGPVHTFLKVLSIGSDSIQFLYSPLGVAIGKTYLVLPYTILILVVTLERIDRDLIAAAHGLGATTWHAYTRVILPLSLPGLWVATLISLIWAVGAFVSPLLLGSPEEMTLAVDVQRQMFENLNWPRGAAEAVMMLVTLALCLVIFTSPMARMRRIRGWG